MKLLDAPEKRNQIIAYRGKTCLYSPRDTTRLGEKAEVVPKRVAWQVAPLAAKFKLCLFSFLLTPFEIFLLFWDTIESFIFQVVYFFFLSPIGTTGTKLREERKNNNCAKL